MLESPAASATSLGNLEAQVTDLKLRCSESLVRERRLIERILEMEEGLAVASAREEELRLQLNRYALFYEAVQRSRPWKMIQSLRRFLGREW
ncbi:MAG TPA: hypothetical protein VJA66_04425 [Thermoanaerobaculia bacterium]